MQPSPFAQHMPLKRKLVRRKVRQRYKGSVLGLAWTLINPPLMVLACWSLFTFLFGTPTPNYAFLPFVGLTIAASSPNADLAKKCRLPRITFPVAATLRDPNPGGEMLIMSLVLSIVLSTFMLLAHVL
jgi:lipopolysaccharide transport system permease protein